MPDFRFRMVDDDALPAPHQWALIDDRGTITAAVKRSAFGPQVVAEILAAYQLLRGQQQQALGLPVVPHQRGNALHLT